MKFSFPKKEKLKRKKLLEQLFETGMGINSYPVKLIYLKTELPEDVQVQAGVTVSKRNFKKAVQRNRIKRLLRESYRLNKHLVFNNIEDNFAFLFLYIGKEMPEYPQVEAGMKAVLLKFVEKNGRT
ncbi:ribonuclease P protein component [Flavobacteriaceae bacterium F89]|uniref:Ribonuclease P protein component n=1 Tax=Cerina litoralis TaxID=2874477 RepID=A0AAE3EVH9_9FLAO|nr:ribonuclease P protein component [Cerina litoralis]MCG2461817.1 ribonuclease P protein component [Cerina litoralis]